VVGGFSQGTDGETRHFAQGEGLRSLPVFVKEREKMAPTIWFLHPARNKNVPFSVLCAVLFSFLLVNCQSTGVTQKKESVLKAKLYHEGLITCFENGVKNSKGEDLYCETSSIVYTKNKLILASDKLMPAGLVSPVFSLPLKNGMPQDVKPEYFIAPPFLKARKLEGLTLTPDNRYILATTSFDRLRKDSSLDGYNTLLIWPVGQPKSVKIVSPFSRNGVVSSLNLKEKFSQALKSKEYPDGPPHFQIEGLTAIPGGKLLFGIREMGRKYYDFDYVIKIVGVSYKFLNGQMILEDDFRLVYDFDPSSVGLKYTIGLSSLEYDQHNNRLYILASFEMGSALGGLIWVLPLADFDAQKAPKLVVNDMGRPFHFDHKAEGLSVIDKSHVIVIHGDSRIAEGRKPNQALFSLIEFDK
jgi:hypothetical protein